MAGARQNSAYILIETPPFILKIKQDKINSSIYKLKFLLPIPVHFLATTQVLMGHDRFFIRRFSTILYDHEVVSGGRPLLFQCPEYIAYVLYSRNLETYMSSRLIKIRL